MVTTKIKIPITGLDAQTAKVPNHDVLTVQQASTDYVHGDGLFPLYQDKMALVEAGTGLNVLVNDYFALIDGYKVAYRGIKNLDWTKKDIVDVTSIVGSGVRYLAIKVGRDTDGSKESKEGVLFLTATVPDARGVIVVDAENDAIPLAKLTIPGGTTQVTAAMIDNTVKKWLADVDKSLMALKQYTDEAVERAKREIYDYVLGEYTSTIRTEIANGDAGVLAVLDASAVLLQSEIDNLAIDIDQVKLDLSNFKVYVDEKVALLASQTAELNLAVIALNDVVTENTTYDAQLAERITSVEGGLVANTASVEDALNRISVLETQNQVVTSVDVLRNTINIAKNGFMIQTMHSVADINYSKGLMDVFQDATKIDPTSTNYAIDAGSQKLVPQGGSEIASLKMNYKFNEPSGSAVIDETGNNNAFLVGTYSRVAGSVGQAVRMSSAYIEIPYNSSPTVWGGNIDKFTFELWFKSVSSSYGGWWDAASSNPSPFSGLGYASDIGVVALAGLIFSDGTTKDCWTSGVPGNFRFPYTQGNWVHLVWTFDSVTGAVKYYCNGALWSSLTAPLGKYLRNPVNGLSCKGGRNQSGTFDLDEIRMYRDVLTAEQVLARYNKQELSTPATFPVVIKSVTKDVGAVPTDAILIAEDSGDITYSASRDGGTTWTTLVKDTSVDISGQPSGQVIKVKISMPAATSYVDNYAVFVK